MKKFLAIVLCLMLVFAFAACGDEKTEESSQAQSQEESSEAESSVPAESSTAEEPSSTEESSQEEKTYFDFLSTAAAVTINQAITSESDGIFTTNDAITSGNCKWTVNVLLEKTADNLYKVVSVAAGDGNDPTISLGANQILLAVHSNSSNMDDVSTYQNVPGKLAAAALQVDEQIAVVGLEQNDIILLKEYEEGDNLVYAQKLPEYLATQFVNFGADYDYDMKPTDAPSIELTKIDDVPAYGDIVLYTSGYGDTIGKNGGDFTDFAVLVVEYTHITDDGVNNFKYHKKQIVNADDTSDKSAIKIPEDGYVVCIHKDQTAMIAKLANIKDTDLIYACGVQTKSVSYNITEINSPITIDGAIEAEWDSHVIDEIDENNTNWDYSQFEKNNYGRTAKIYAAYDKDQLYFAVVVQSPDCVWLPGATPTSCSGLWQYESIQFNIIDQSSLSDYMIAHCNHGTDGSAVSEDHVRQYGFCGNDKGESCATVYMGGTHTTFTGKVSVVRNDEAEETIYEFTIPWVEANVEETIEAGLEISFSFSINSSVDTSRWQNIKMRDGGGIIRMNEFSKMPVVTLD